MREFLSDDQIRACGSTILVETIAKPTNFCGDPSGGDLLCNRSRGVLFSEMLPLLILRIQGRSTSIMGSTPTIPDKSYTCSQIRAVFMRREDIHGVTI